MVAQPLIVNQKTAAKMLGISDATFWRWRQTGQIKPLPEFKTPKYSVDELRRLTNSNPVTQEAA